MWLNKTDPKPKPIPKKVKKIKKLAPIITSGDTIKTLFKASKVFRPFLFLV